MDEYREFRKFKAMLDRARIPNMLVRDTGTDECPVVITVENLEVLTHDDEVLRIDVVFNFDPLHGTLQRVFARKG